MKKFMVMLVAAAALTASADYYLSWTVTGAPINYSYATLYAVKSGETSVTDLGDGDAEIPVNLSVLGGGSENMGGASTVLTSLGNSTKAYYGEGYSYYFELFNANNEAVAWWNGIEGDGDEIPWLDIEEYVYKDSTSQNKTLELTSSMFKTTPEPTSGLMLLLGLAGLALKRKRA